MRHRALKDRSLRSDSRDLALRAAEFPLRLFGSRRLAESLRGSCVAALPSISAISLHDIDMRSTEQYCKALLSPTANDRTQGFVILRLAGFYGRPMAAPHRLIALQRRTVASPTISGMWHQEAR